MVVAALSASGCGNASILPDSVNHGEYCHSDSPAVENSDRKCQNVVTDSRVAPDEGSNLTCGTGLCRDDRSLEAKEPRCGFDCALQSGQILALSPARVEWEPRRNLMGLSVENSRRKLHNATRNSTKFLHSPWRQFKRWWSEWPSAN